MKKNLICFLAAMMLAIVCAQAKMLHEKKSDKRGMTLLYWNIQNGMWDGQTDDYHRFTSWVQVQKPDICVWCEAQKLYVTGTDNSEVESEEECLERWRRLAERYGHAYVYLSAHPDNYPQLITSRFPLESEKLITGNADTIVCHGASWYKLRRGRKTLNIVTLHTWPHAFGYKVPHEQREASRGRNEGDLFRRAEMEYICRQTVLTHPSAHKELWAMMGDFNSISRLDNATYQLPEGSTRFFVHDYIIGDTPYVDLIHESYPQQFISTTGGKSRIDFLYVTPALQKRVCDVSVIRDDYTTPVRNPQGISNFWHPSDHCPILLHFDFGKQ